MGPGGCRPSHSSAEDQITPTPGLMNRRASHLLQNLFPSHTRVRDPLSAMKLPGWASSAKTQPPQCNGGLFTRRLADPQSPKDGRQLACPPFGVRFRSRWGSLVGSVAVIVEGLRHNVSKTGIYAQRARVDQAVGLYYQKENLTF